MAALSSLLVAIDFSSSSRRALDVAIALAKRTGAAIELLHVWNPSHMAGPGELLPELESWIGQQGDSLARQLERWRDEVAAAGVPATSLVVTGVASRAIPERARDAHPDLVILGRRGSAGLAHVLLGSVSERVIHQSSRPVLIVPDESRGRDCPERLLVGVDFSDGSREAFRVARRLAADLPAARGLLVAHVRPIASELLLGYAAEAAYEGEYPYDLAALQNWLESEGGDALPIEPQVLDGRGDEQLAATARAADCDWIVVGVHGRSALSALLMGSTTHRLLKQCDRPVLVVAAGAQPPGEASS